MTGRLEPAAMAEETAAALTDAARPADRHPVRAGPRRARHRDGLRGRAGPHAPGRRQSRARAPRALMIPGLRVGHVTDAIGLTGCTVILTDAPAVGGVEIRGWAAGVHGLEFLDPRHLVPTLDGIVLAGGSAFGLEAIWGVMRYLEERGVGFPTSQTVVPHVAGAILYDLGLGDSTARPDRAMGHRAARRRAAGAGRRGQRGRGHRRQRGQAPRHRARDQGRARVRGPRARRRAPGRVHGRQRGRRRARSRDRPAHRGDARRRRWPPADRHRRRARRGRPAPRVPPDQHHHRPGGDDGGARQGGRRAGGPRWRWTASRARSRRRTSPRTATRSSASRWAPRAPTWTPSAREAATLVARAIARAVRAATAAGGLPAARDLA